MKNKILKNMILSSRVREHDSLSLARRITVDKQRQLNGNHPTSRKALQVKALPPPQLKTIGNITIYIYIWNGQEAPADAYKDTTMIPWQNKACQQGASGWRLIFWPYTRLDYHSGTHEENYLLLLLIL